jgi:hypothetical protein
MDDVLRKRLSEEELKLYDTYDQRASIASHFVVWPLIAGLVSFAADRMHNVILCLVIAAIAFPVVVIMGRRAGALRATAEQRYAAIMGRADSEDGDAKEKPQDKQAD